MKAHKLSAFLAAVIFSVYACEKPSEETLDTEQSQEQTPPAAQPQEPSTEDKDIRILAIGNSFSVDAMQYLYGILEDIGYEDIVLGNLYIGGCSLQTHVSKFSGNSASYKYFLNTDGEWTSTESYRPLDALNGQDWDYITLQQASGSSGMPGTFDPYLNNMISTVKLYHPDACLVWHMTWAYQANCTLDAFQTNYGKDQMTMYNAIVDVVKEKILTNKNFSAVIPNGTAVQNLRTSFIGDNLTRDGYHMSYDNGRFLTALTFAKAITGCDLNDVTYVPSEYSYSSKTVSAIKDAVDKAIADPYKVTASAYPPEKELDYSKATPEDILEHAGYNPADYVKKDMEFTKFAFYNSESKSEMSTLQNSTNPSLNKQFVATPIFSKADLPNGSLIIIRTGNLYRPEGWTSLDVMNGKGEGKSGYSRPGKVTKNIAVVNDSWWSDWNYRAFNISLSSGAVLTDATADELIEGFAIFVPAKE